MSELIKYIYVYNVSVLDKDDDSKDGDHDKIDLEAQVNTHKSVMFNKHKHELYVTRKGAASR